MDNTTNALNWFEIPVTDMQRAKHFYQVVFGIHMEEYEYAGNGNGNGRFSNGEWEAVKLSGALVKSDYHRPSKDGVVIYLNANPDMRGNS